ELAGPARRQGRVHAGAMGFGVLHGAAGAGHVFALLPTLVLGEVEAIVYLTAYVLAATVAMSAAGALVGRMLVERAEIVRRVAIAGSGALAAAVGVGWMIA
nr:hypothetical protein [Myxococcota bacterium]